MILKRGSSEIWELNGNNITRINKNDFAGLKQLRVLQLMENQIGLVERGVFDDMRELERLCTRLSDAIRKTNYDKGNISPGG
ncbi:hypothetical protein EYD10_01109 [Varanus komodoensis]|nr:hypothetical protein EYD10_01109 [Varanus komodoensis]